MKELVIFSGLPGAGKSTYYRERFAATHVHVSKDLMSPNAARKDEKQRALIEAALRDGLSVVVDNTNATPAIRAEIVAIGRRFGARVVAVHFECPVRVCVARNRGREGRGRVPDVAIFTVAKKLVAPAAGEGFDDVLVVHCTEP